MNPITSESFGAAMRSVYTEDKIEEMMTTQSPFYQGTLPLTYPRGQVRFTGNESMPYSKTFTMPTYVDPSAVKMAKIRKAELEQRIAKLKRKGKPSYRQRQRNARAAKG